jgi:hypothetical protein
MVVSRNLLSLEQVWGDVLIIGRFRQTRFSFFLYPRGQPRSALSDGNRQSGKIATSSALFDGVTTKLRASKHRFLNLGSKLPCGLRFGV